MAAAKELKCYLCDEGKSKPLVGTLVVKGEEGHGRRAVCADDVEWLKDNGFSVLKFKPVGAAQTLPTDPTARKNTPMVRGLLDYFPAALAEVAAVSKAGNDQHNPGQPLHHARGKSTDHADCIVRHLMDRGTKDTDGQRHSAKVAWRALALLQEELEAEGAPLARGARKPDKKEGA